MNMFGIDFQQIIFDLFVVFAWGIFLGSFLQFMTWFIMDFFHRKGAR
jgi:hypothetical protein